MFNWIRFSCSFDWMTESNDLVYADDTTLFATSSQSAVESLSPFQNAASVLGMHISWPKTKVQNLGTGQPLSDVSVDAHNVDCVDNFTYLGSVQSSDGYSRPDIRRRIALAASVMSSLSIIWRDQRLLLSTKTRIYQTLVVSVLLYASDTIRYDSVYLTCSKKLTGSQLSLPHGDMDTTRCWCQDTRGLPHEVSTADPPHPLAGSHSQLRGRCAYRPTPSNGEHQETTWSHLWARGENVTQHSSSPSIETTGRGITR